MKIILRLSLALVLCSVLAAAILASVARLTQDARAQAAKAVKMTAIGGVLPPYDDLQEAGNLETADGRQATFYRALQAGRLVGIAAETASAKGYGGQVTLLVGFNPDRTVRAVVTVAHNETPGLGSAVLERTASRTLADVLRRTPPPAGLPANRYLDQFTGQTLATTPDAWRVRQDDGTLDAVSGATVSSRAAADAVQALARILAQHQDTLFAPPPAGTAAAQGRD
ncbi:MAG: RnfABCDGE type electron transport complex subunit G [Lentisphaeria bacterium]|jgi:electron transport complex protein RnfG